MERPEQHEQEISRPAPLDLRSHTIADNKREALQRLFPGSAGAGFGMCFGERAPQPLHAICLDAGFADNDQLKANAVQLFKGKEVVFKTV